ncbi:hypothetical protein [Burkholderia ubonensis]|uniref:hypothetical protein n=1 Tax=Burkholderia ubonensis TaxID=101571 RepID=UPI0012F7B94D|nr:hypothetical protein [Burkholderia ubonensis]
MAQVDNGTGRVSDGQGCPMENIEEKEEREIGQIPVEDAYFKKLNAQIATWWGLH